MNVIVRELGLVDYATVWEAMRRFTDTRTDANEDELWFLEHPPVFTLGLGGKRKHILDPGTIPVIHVDRGGQVTYHGPGQLIVYVLVDLPRLGWGVRKLVCALEQSVIDLLDEFGILAARRPGAPGVYIGESKVAALGLRVRRGRTYHGLALNVNMDLSPFSRINPCGYPGLTVTQIREHRVPRDVKTIARSLLPYLIHNLSYNPHCAQKAAVPIIGAPIIGEQKANREWLALGDW
jgi:lipoyl(octanoyl) transferase